MKLIIAGGRDLIVPTWVIKLILRKHGITPTEVVSGACGLGESELEIINERYADGIDGCGERWAVENGLHLVRKPANWQAHGLSAGPKRNAEMAEYADVLLVIWDGKSKGSRNMKIEMEKRGKRVINQIVNQNLPHRFVKNR